MGVFSRIKHVFVPEKSKKRRNISVSGLQKRGFSASTVDRFTGNWSTAIESSTRELRYALPVMRSRSRFLANNNEYGRRFLDLCVENIVGATGVAMECLGKTADGNPDTPNNEMIEAAWADWGRRGLCTMDGQLSWRDLQRLVIESTARDGEILLRPVVGRAAGNKYGFALQVLEIDHLDDRYSQDADSTGSITMGVQVDTFGKPINYYLTVNHPGDYGYQGIGAREKVPAANLMHIFMPHRPHQRRGYPWLAASMRALYSLGDYIESEGVAARVAAGKMGFYVPGDGASDMDFDDKDEEDGTPIQEVEPGMLEKLPPGWKVETLDWQHPSSQFESFVKEQLRGVSSGGGVAYHSLTGDLTQANYSSLREGRIAATDGWRIRQEWFAEWVCQPIFERWLEMAFTTGAVKLPMRKLEAFSSPRWVARGWQWVDPLKESEASRMSLALGLTTRTAILAEKGENFDEVIKKIAAEAKAMRDLGLNPDVPIGTTSAAPAGAASDGSATEGSSPNEDAQGDGNNQDGSNAPSGKNRAGWKARRRQR